MGELAAELQQLPQCALLAAAFITYMSAAPEDVRATCLADWAAATGVRAFDMRRFLSTESEQLVWKAEGLPSDELSVENALVILQVGGGEWERGEGEGRGVGGGAAVRRAERGECPRHTAGGRRGVGEGRRGGMGSRGRGCRQTNCAWRTPSSYCRWEEGSGRGEKGRGGE